VIPGANPDAVAAVITPFASTDVTIMVTSCVGLLPPTSVPSTVKVSPTTYGFADPEPPALIVTV
jgi:hypothetical protein